MLNMLESYALGKNHQVHCLFSDSLSAHSFRHILVFNLLLATKLPCRWGRGMRTQDAGVHIKNAWHEGVHPLGYLLKRWNVNHGFLGR